MVLKFSVFLLTNSLPMHPFSNPCKHQKTLTENLKPYLLRWHFLNISQSSHLYLSTIGFKMLSHCKFFSVLIADWAAPPEMIDTGFYTWLELLKVLLFAQLSKLFLYLLSRDKHETESLIYPSLYACNDRPAYVSQW